MQPLRDSFPSRYRFHEVAAWVAAKMRPNIFLSKAEGGHAKLGDFGLSTEMAAQIPTESVRSTSDYVLTCIESVVVTDTMVAIDEQHHQQPK